MQKIPSINNSGVHLEQHSVDAGGKLNWLRAAVLGANDGIVSVSSIIVGIAAAGATEATLFTAGIASIVAGALSMAVGEYVSVSTQRDTEKALLAKERWELENEPENELIELTAIYKKKGLSQVTAEIVAKELTAHDAFAAHVDAELGINPDDLTNPWHAAYASALAFFAGAIVPLLAMILSPTAYKIELTFVAVGFALFITGSLSAHVGEANKTRAVIRVVLGGILAMAITFGVGKLFGLSGAI
jgi:VIT1/CCC1 family predicted Fe2+/Mn2+ transporter